MSNTLKASVHEGNWTPYSQSIARPVSVAVLVPCYNEAITIASVVDRFKRSLPQAQIYVYDNNSSDDTAEVAKKHGAVVRTEGRQGKGNVIRRMFADIEADVYVMVDGDDTYEAEAAPHLIARLLNERLDFVNGGRRETAKDAYRRGHRLGNRLLSGIVQQIFGRQFNDMLSGYKVFSRRFVKSFPAMSRGFETETELAIHALELRMPCTEVMTFYKERPEGSVSKLNTYRDGWRILMLIVRLIKDERPLVFFGTIGLIFSLSALGFGLPIFLEWMKTGLVPRLPTAILSSALVLLGVFSFFTGLILDLITKTRAEMKRLAYLAVPAFEGGFSDKDH